MSLQYKRYDLVWSDDGVKRGYKLAVDCAVDVHVMPAEVSSLLEKDAQGVTWMEPQPALKRSMDLMWESGGGLRGYEGVVSSKVNVNKLPAQVARHIRPTDIVKDQPHEYVTPAPLKNHMYTKTSQLIGQQAHQPVVQNDATHPWNGLNGKFTSAFPSNAATGTSLNCSATRHIATKGPSFGTTPYFEGRIT